MTLDREQHSKDPWYQTNLGAGILVLIISPVGSYVFGAFFEDVPKPLVVLVGAGVGLVVLLVLSFTRPSWRKRVWGWWPPLVRRSTLARAQAELSKLKAEADSERKVHQERLRDSELARVRLDEAYGKQLRKNVETVDQLGQRLKAARDERAALEAKYANDVRQLRERGDASATTIRTLSERNEKLESQLAAHRRQERDVSDLGKLIIEHQPGEVLGKEALEAIARTTGAPDLASKLRKRLEAASAEAYNLGLKASGSSTARISQRTTPAWEIRHIKDSSPTAFALVNLRGEPAFDVRLHTDDIGWASDHPQGETWSFISAASVASFEGAVSKRAAKEGVSFIVEWRDASRNSYRDQYRLPPLA